MHGTDFQENVHHKVVTENHQSMGWKGSVPQALLQSTLGITCDGLLVLDFAVHMQQGWLYVVGAHVVFVWLCDGWVVVCGSHSSG